MESEATQTESEVTQMSSEVPQMSSEVTQMSSEVTQMSSEVTQMSSEVTQMSSEVPQMSSEVPQMSSEVTQMESKTLYIIAVQQQIGNALSKIAPQLSFKFITIPNVHTLPALEEFGDLEHVEFITCPSVILSLLINAGIHFPNLKWVHVFSTGIDIIQRAFKKMKILPHYIITRSTRVAVKPVAEYVIAQILANQRRLYEFYDQQKAMVWNRRTCETRLVSDSTVVILGVGNIGKRVAEICKALHMTVHGVTRRPVEKGQGSPQVDLYRTHEDLDMALEVGDVIVNLLPSTDETRGLLDRKRLSACKKKPLFINAGRGDVITEDSIIEALKEGWIWRAVLDVFHAEPLTPDSLLWKEPNVILTPHAAVDMNSDTCEEYAKLILDNYTLLVKGHPLIGVVDINSPY